LIGRTDDNRNLEVSFSDITISDIHAAILYENSLFNKDENHFYIRDYESHHGTFLYNKEKSTFQTVHRQKRSIENEMIIKFGSVECQLIIHQTHDTNSNESVMNQTLDIPTQQYYVDHDKIIIINESNPLKHDIHNDDFRHDNIRNDNIRSDVISHDNNHHDDIRHDNIRHDDIRHDDIRHNSMAHSPVQYIKDHQRNLHYENPSPPFKRSRNIIPSNESDHDDENEDDKTDDDDYQEQHNTMHITSIDQKHNPSHSSIVEKSFENQSNASSIDSEESADLLASPANIITTNEDENNMPSIAATEEKSLSDIKSPLVLQEQEVISMEVDVKLTPATDTTEPQEARSSPKAHNVMLVTDTASHSVYDITDRRATENTDQMLSHNSDQIHVNRSIQKELMVGQSRVDDNADDQVITRKSKSHNDLSTEVKRQRMDDQDDLHLSNHPRHRSLIGNLHRNNHLYFSDDSNNDHQDDQKPDQKDGFPIDSPNLQYVTEIRNNLKPKPLLQFVNELSQPSESFHEINSSEEILKPMFSKIVDVSTETTAVDTPLRKSNRRKNSSASKSNYNLKGLEITETHDQMTEKSDETKAEDNDIRIMFTGTSYS
jgi:hypothetical protein